MKLQNVKCSYLLTQRIMLHAYVKIFLLYFSQFFLSPDNNYFYNFKQ